MTSDRKKAPVTRRDLAAAKQPAVLQRPTTKSRRAVREAFRISNPWAQIPVETRRAIIADLRVRPFPWIMAHRILAKKFRVKKWEIASLIQAIALFGFDDPGLNGIEPSE